MYRRALLEAYQYARRRCGRRSDGCSNGITALIILTLVVPISLPIIIFAQRMGSAFLGRHEACRKRGKFIECIDIGGELSKSHCTLSF